MITFEVLLLVVGLILTAQGIRRILKPGYKLIQSQNEETMHKRKRSIERGSNSIILNMAENIAFNDDDRLAKEAVSLLAITEEDMDMNDLLIRDS